MAGPGRRDGPIAGVVLAGGASTRMGSAKLLLPLGGESVLRRAARRALAAGLDPVIVVLGHEAGRLLPELAGLPCRAVHNPDRAGGIRTSLRTGIAAVPPEAIAAVVALADMALVTEAMIAALAGRFRESDAPLVVSDYQGVLAPPVLYGRSLFPELIGLKGEGGGKQVVKRHLSEAVVLSWPAAALGDLDEPADYERIRVEPGGERGP